MEVRTESLKNLILSQSKYMADRMSAITAPVFTLGEQSDMARTIRALCKGKRKKPYTAQMEVICALLKGFLTKRALGLVAEMGCGKVRRIGA